MWRWVAIGQLREMGGKVGSAPYCYGSALGSNPDIYQKYDIGDIATIALLEMARVLKGNGRKDQLVPGKLWEDI